MKRYPALMLAFVLAFSFLPNALAGEEKAEVFYTGAWDYKLDQDGTAVIVGYYGHYFHGKSFEVDVPEELDGRQVTGIGDRVFYECTSLTGITIPETVVSIGEEVFSGCSSLEDITIPESVTRIGKYAFAKSGLKSVTIPGSVTSIAAYLFDDCEYLSDVEIREGVVSIEEGAFNNCGLRSVSIPDSVVDIRSNPFRMCYELTNIEVSPDHQVMGVNEGVLVSKTDKRLICYPCGYTDTSYSIPREIQSIGDYAFYGCRTLNSIMLPESVISIGKSAFGCNASLTEIKIPESVTGIGDYAFEFCSSLEEITIPASVVSIGYAAFSSCNSLMNVTIREGAGSIGEHAFRYCHALKDLTIPGSVISIGDWAFGGCSALEGITILKGVTDIGAGAFADCSSLTHVLLPESLTGIGEGAFQNCSSLTGVSIPQSVAMIGERAFRKCSSLTDVTIPNGVKVIGNSTFEDCSSLTGVTIPDSVTVLGDYSFLDCSFLTGIRIPEGVTEIGRMAFSNCLLLADITIPDSVTVIGDRVFEGCRFLTATVVRGSYAEKYCWENRVRYLYEAQSAEGEIPEIQVSVLPGDPDDPSAGQRISLKLDGFTLNLGEDAAYELGERAVNQNYVTVRPFAAKGDTVTEINVSWNGGMKEITVDHFRKYLTTIEEQMTAQYEASGTTINSFEISDPVSGTLGGEPCVRIDMQVSLSAGGITVDAGIRYLYVGSRGYTFLISGIGDQKTPEAAADALNDALVWQ